MAADTFKAAVDEFLEEADWIGESHPLAFGLRTAAAELDKKFVTSLWTEYNKTVKHIDELRPVVESDEEDDPLLTPVTGLETRGA